MAVVKSWENKAKPNGVERIGFYGCHVLDRPIRVKPAVPGDYPRTAKIRKCKCGNPHRVHLMWRPLADGEAKRYDLQLKPSPPKVIKPVKAKR